jgi:hypothetical protein
VTTPGRGGRRRSGSQDRSAQGGPSPTPQVDSEPASNMPCSLPTFHKTTCVKLRRSPRRGRARRRPAPRAGEGGRPRGCQVRPRIPLVGFCEPTQGTLRRPRSHKSGSNPACTRASDGARVTLAVRGVDLLADDLPLLPLECRHGDPASLRCRPDQCSVHELQHRPLPGGVRNHFHPSPLLPEEPLQQIGRADDLAVGDRE